LAEDATVTVDHRLFSDGGQNAIAEDFEKTGELAVQAGQAAADGADYIADEIAVLGDDLPEEMREQLGESGERFVDELIREDLSDEQIADILNKENIQTGLAGLEDADQRLQQNPASRLEIVEDSELPVLSANTPELSLDTADTGLVIEITSGNPVNPNALQVGVAGLGKVQQEIDTLVEIDPELAQGIQTAISVATGGPLKAAVGEAINQGIEAVAGDAIHEVQEAVVSYTGGAIQGEAPRYFNERLQSETADPTQQEGPLGWSATDTKDGIALGATILGVGGLGKKAIGGDKREGSAASPKADEQHVTQENRERNNDSSLPESDKTLIVPKEKADVFSDWVRAAEEGELVRTDPKTVRGSGFRKALTEEQGPPPGTGYDADHKIELCVGGANCAKTNGQWLESSPNRASGPKVYNQVKDDPIGTKYTNVKLEE
jgi:hypothetical protein